MGKKKDIIVFQGGGNFGDLYYGPQQIRLKAIKELKNNKIIILPQTIHFESKKIYMDCCDIMSKHGDLHICVRDAMSFELASKMTRNVYLMPDMAHQLWPININSVSKNKLLKLIRKDKESNLVDCDHNSSMDWSDILMGKEKFFKDIHMIMRVLHLLKIDRPIINIELNTWVWYAQKVISTAYELFSKYEMVITDRLHGHILSCLMSIPNTVIDNSYGKNILYSNEWTCKSDIVTVKK